MSLVVSQNWDGVTPPAIPAGWNVDSQLTTSASQHVSSPNSLVMSSGPFGPYYFGTYGTDDGSGSSAVNISLSTALKFTGGPTSTTFNGGLTWRGSSSTLNFVNTIFYALQLKDSEKLGNGGLIFSKIVNGVETVLVTLNASSNFGTSSWFTISLTFSGGGATTNSTQAAVQRQSDGFWLNSSGVFQSGSAVALTSSNNDITTGGFAGVLASGPSVNNFWLDDWSLNSGTPVTFSPYMYQRTPVYRPPNTPFWA